LRIFISIFLLLFFVQLTAQNKGFKLNAKDQPLEKVLVSLENQYDLLFSYKTNDVSPHIINIEKEYSHIKSLLKDLLRHTDLEFENINSQNILIRKIRTREICGYIIDALSNSPLPYANIYIKGSNVGVSSDEDGKFIFKHTFKKDQQLEVSYMGYDKETVSYTYFNKTSCPKLTLSVPKDLEPLLVVKDYIIDGIDLTNNGSATVLRPNRLSNLPGQSEPNVLESIKILPGISSPTSKASDIFIRGGTPDQNLILWEDIPIYHSAHYFGMISAIDPFIVDKMNIYRGGFGAEYGGRIASVIDIETLDERSQVKKLGFGTNMTHGYLYGVQPIGLDKSTAVSFSVRRSFSELGETPTFRNISRVNQQGFIIGTSEVAALPDHIKIFNDFNFIDSHLKFSSQITSQDRVQVSGLYVKNNFSNEIIDDRRMKEQRDSMVLENKGFSAKWERQWSNKIKSELGYVNTDYRYKYEYRLQRFASTNPILKGLKENQIKDKQFSASATYTTDKEQLISIGYTFTNYDINFNVQQDSREDRNNNDNGDTSSGLHSTFLSYTNPINNKIGLNMGLRSNYYNITDRFYFEPRVRVAYKLNNDINLSAYFGRHYQYVSQVTVYKGNESGISLPIWALAEDKGVPVQEASAYQIGALYKKKSWTVDLQIYSKELKGLNSRAYDFEQIQEDSPEIGLSNTKGFDILIKKRFNNFNSWLSYTLSETTLAFTKTLKKEFPADHDQTHVLEWTNQIAIKNFQFAVGLKIASGLPYTSVRGFDIESSPGNPLSYNLKYEGINNKRLDRIEEVNLSGTYKFKTSVDSWEGYLGFSITNLLNRDNINSRDYIVDIQNGSTPMPTLETLDKTNLRFTPNLSLRIEW